MHITKLRVKQFRCFSSFDISLDAPVVLITGANGSGKTSLLEAMHYLCYLRSFRTHLPKELVAFDDNTFFIQAQIAHDALMHEIQVGFAGKKKVVKLDARPVSSYKELNQTYRALTLTQDDLLLIHGGPEIRRDFLDQALALLEPEYVTHLRTYRTIVQNRNALLHRGKIDHESYAIWTEKVWTHATVMQQKRQALLHQLQEITNQVLQTHFAGAIQLEFAYKAKKVEHGQSFQDFLEQNPRLREQEEIMGRSLFGAHLDDIALQFQQKASKAYASRGQQKLLVLLIKRAFMQLLTQQRGPAIFLLDDFMADFDHKTIEILIPLLQELDTQLIFTSPAATGHFEQLLLNQNCQHICLTP